MPRKSNNAVNASFDNGFSNSEIAQKFNLTPGAVRARRTRWKSKTPDVPSLVQEKNISECYETPADELAHRREQKSRSQTAGNMAADSDTSTLTVTAPVAQVFEQVRPGELPTMSQLKQVIWLTAQSAENPLVRLKALNTYLRALKVEQTLPVAEDEVAELKMTAEETADRILRMLGIS